MRAIKLAVDRDNARGQFLLSGSTRFLTVPTLSESLAGRAVFLELWPFAVAERAGRPGDLLDRAFRRDRQPAHAVPVELDPGRVPGPDLCRRLPGSGGLPHRAQPPDVERQLPRHRGVPGHRRVRPGAEGARHPPVASAHPAKTYLTDPGLAASLLGLSAAALRPPGHLALGGLVETFVFGELLRLRAVSETTFSIHHYRDRNGREVDFVLEAPDGRVLAIEVKAAMSPGSGEARQLRFLADQLGDRFAGGILLHLGNRTLPVGDRVVAAPLSTLWGGAPLR